MRRRDLLKSALPAITANQKADSSVTVPILRLVDAKCRPEHIRHFCSTVWEEATRDFSRCGVALQTIEHVEEIRKHPTGLPRFEGLDRSRVNVVLTDHVPMAWDSGRGLSGVATIYEGVHLCVIGLNYAGRHRIPFLAVNTVEHELLHIFLQDIFVPRGGIFHSQRRELRVDWYATQLWLFQSGAEVRRSTAEYLKRLANLRA